MPMQCWSVNPRLRFPEQTRLVVLSLFLCTLRAWGFQPLVPLHPFILRQWHEGSSGCSTCYFASLRCDRDRQQLPNAVVLTLG